MRNFIAVSNSTIYDVCLNTYGTLDLLVKLMYDNAFPGVNEYPVAGQIFVFDETLVFDQLVYSRLANAENSNSRTEANALKYATRYKQVGTDINPDDDMTYEKTLTAEYVAGADGESFAILLPLAGIGARIVQIERELKPMRSVDFSFNANSGRINLLNGVTLAEGETLFIIYVVMVTE